MLVDLAYTLLSDTCTPAEGPDAPLWLDVMAHFSLAINTLFMLEIPVTIWAMGFGHYNPLGSTPHAGLHLFDGMIIVTTFVLEVILKGRERELAGLLIVLRLWRLVKLVGGKNFFLSLRRYSTDTLSGRHRSWLERDRGRNRPGTR